MGALNSFQEALITRVSQKATARVYRGELSDLENIKSLGNDLPLVLVDYVGDRHEGALKKYARFNLYIVHLAYNEKKLETNTLGLLDLCDELDLLLSGESLDNSRPISLLSMQKMYDGKSGRAYLSAYVRTLEARINI